jgi:hypothetical protein
MSKRIDVGRAAGAFVVYRRRVCLTVCVVCRLNDVIGVKYVCYYDNIDFAFLEANATGRQLSWCIAIVAPRGVGVALAAGDASRPMRTRDDLSLGDLLPRTADLSATFGDALWSLSRIEDGNEPTLVSRVSRLLSC